MMDRNKELKRDIVREIEPLGMTKHLLMIRRLVRWCAAKEI